MNKLVLHGPLGRTREVDLRSPRLVVIAVMAVVFVLGGVFAAGSVLGAYWAEAKPGQQMQTWSLDLDRQRQEVASARRLLQDTVDALAMRVGDMNAHVIRLDALGKRLTQVAGLHPSEFNFDQPAVKVPAVVAGRGADLPVLTDVLDRLADQISDRERKMGALENVVLAKQMGTEVVPQGAPITKGFISSQFGRRSDPFTGYTAFHPGVDFAGKVSDLSLS